MSYKRSYLDHFVTLFRSFSQSGQTNPITLPLTGCIG